VEKLFANSPNQKRVSSLVQKIVHGLTKSLDIQASRTKASLYELESHLEKLNLKHSRLLHDITLMLTGEQRHKIVKRYINEDSKELFLSGDFIKGKPVDIHNDSLTRFNKERPQKLLQGTEMSIKNLLNLIDKDVMKTAGSGNLKAISRIDSNKIRNGASQVLEKKEQNETTDTFHKYLLDANTNIKQLMSELRMKEVEMSKQREELKKVNVQVSNLKSLMTNCLIKVNCAISFLGRDTAIQSQTLKVIKIFSFLQNRLKEEIGPDLSFSLQRDIKDCMKELEEVHELKNVGINTELTSSQVQFSETDSNCTIEMIEMKNVKLQVGESNTTNEVKNNPFTVFRLKGSEMNNVPRYKIEIEEVKLGEVVKDKSKSLVGRNESHRMERSLSVKKNVRTQLISRFNQNLLKGNNKVVFKNINKLSKLANTTPIKNPKDLSPPKRFPYYNS